MGLSLAVDMCSYFDAMAKYWYVKIIVLLITLVGVLWMIGALKSGSYYTNPNSPVQILLGGQAPESSEIKAKIVKPTPNPSPTPPSH